MVKTIGLTPRIIYENNVRKQYINERYLNILHKNGFNTIILTLNCPNLTAILDKCDGFVLPGGDDIDPLFYNEVNEGLSKNLDGDTDNIDKTVIEYCIKSQKPLLGICRGLQAINVFMGGTLNQDIGSSHQNTFHTLVGTNIDDINFNNHCVNSHHHQTIKILAPKFKIIAKSSDDVIEAIMHESLPIIAFQWHPEMDLNNPLNQQIFNYFQKLINNNH